MEEVTKESVKALVEEKDKLEEELKQCYQALKAQNTDMTEPLVDEEGFPKSNIDVYSVRNLRHEIICKENDYKALMQKIEAGIVALHAKAKLDNPQTAPMETEDLEPSRISNTPFAKVDTVTSGSPAADSGLKVGDVVIQVGSLSAANFKEMKQVAEIVQSSIGSNLKFTVLRDDKVLRLSLKPQKWSGNGLLGCLITPLSQK